MTTFDNCTKFSKKRLHIGICGSIACYKILDLIRMLKKLDIFVSATLTDAAKQFITPLLFSSLGAEPVYEEIFDKSNTNFAHLEPSQIAQAFLIAPATATTIAKITHGDASNMLSAQYLSFDGPIVIAPAMNPKMWSNQATQANVKILQKRGVNFIWPEQGTVACNDTGIGKLAQIEEIFLNTLKALSPQDMQNKKVLITLGPTQEYWDDVRFLSNPSSGKMGASLAIAAWLRGANVTAICGPTNVYIPKSIKTHYVTSADQMAKTTFDLWSNMDIGIFSAAVADFSPKQISGKFKKSTSPNKLSLELKPNIDILKTILSKKNNNQKIVGFAAESAKNTKELLNFARIKKESKNVDLLVANNILDENSGFNKDINTIAVLDKFNHETLLQTQSKADIAWELCSWLLKI